MRVLILIDNNNYISGFSIPLSEEHFVRLKKVHTTFIAIDTNLDLEQFDIVGNYKVVDEQLVELTDEEKMLQIKEPNKIDTLNTKIDVIKDYKWDVSARGFEYDGYIQSNRERDCTMMYRCRLGLELGVEPFIPWKLPDNTHAIITDHNYFLEMEILSTRIIQKCFGIEEIILAELKLLETIEELLAYDEKARFDELYNMS